MKKLITNMIYSLSKNEIRQPKNYQKKTCFIMSL